jgi:VWFA-related protein
MFYWTLILFTLGSPMDGEPPTPPVPIEKTERSEVRLVLLDTVVVDSDGQPVAELEREDFEIRSGGEAWTPEVFENHCELQTVEQPMTADRKTSPRRIVLLFDYLHLPMIPREWSLDTAKKMVKEGKTNGDEVMVAALTGGLRIEQPFTTDSRKVLASLKRMQKDVSLWNGNFSHMSETGFVSGITSLFDVLATASTGPKAVVLFSSMADVPLDLEFENIAAIAAVSRTALYTVDPSGLQPPDVSRARPPAG